nr:hypothetical protein [Candidatus Sigynarchaeum springense]
MRTQTKLFSIFLFAMLVGVIFTPAVTAINTAQVEYTHGVLWGGTGERYLNYNFSFYSRSEYYTTVDVRASIRYTIGGSNNYGFDLIENITNIQIRYNHPLNTSPYIAFYNQNVSRMDFAKDFIDEVGYNKATGTYLNASRGTSITPITNKTLFTIPDITNNLTFYTNNNSYVAQNVNDEIINRFIVSSNIVGRGNALQGESPSFAPFNTFAGENANFTTAAIVTGTPINSNSNNATKTDGSYWIINSTNLGVGKYGCLVNFTFQNETNNMLKEHVTALDFKYTGNNNKSVLPGGNATFMIYNFNKSMWVPVNNLTRTPVSINQVNVTALKTFRIYGGDKDKLNKTINIHDYMNGVNNAVALQLNLTNNVSTLLRIDNMDMDYLESVYEPKTKIYRHAIFYTPLALAGYIAETKRLYAAFANEDANFTTAAIVTGTPINSNSNNATKTDGSYWIINSTSLGGGKYGILMNFTFQNDTSSTVKKDIKAFEFRFLGYNNASIASFNDTTFLIYNYNAAKWVPVNNLTRTPVWINQTSNATGTDIFRIHDGDRDTLNQPINISHYMFGPNNMVSLRLNITNNASTLLSIDNLDMDYLHYIPETVPPCDGTFWMRITRGSDGKPTTSGFFGLWVDSSSSFSMTPRDPETYTWSSGAFRWRDKFEIGYPKIGTIEQAFYDSASGILLEYYTEQCRAEFQPSPGGNVVGENPQGFQFKLVSFSSGIASQFGGNAEPEVPGYSVIAVFVASSIGFVIVCKKFRKNKDH